MKLQFLNRRNSYCIPCTPESQVSFKCTLHDVPAQIMRIWMLATTTEQICVKHNVPLSQAGYHLVYRTFSGNIQNMLPQKILMSNPCLHNSSVSLICIQKPIKGNRLKKMQKPIKDEGKSTKKAKIWHLRDSNQGLLGHRQICTG